MSINNIEATKYFDEVRAYFAPQTQARKAIDLIVRAGLSPDEGAFIGIFDGNNPDAIPLVLMSNKTATGRHWVNQVASGEVFHVVNQALIAFAKQKQEWDSAKYHFTLNEASGFLVEFMKRISSFLR